MRSTYQKKKQKCFRKRIELRNIWLLLAFFYLGVLLFGLYTLPATMTTFEIPEYVSDIVILKCVGADWNEKIANMEFDICLMKQTINELITRQNNKVPFIQNGILIILLLKYHSLNASVKVIY